jgi:protein O-GlcNAc transferase
LEAATALAPAMPIPAAALAQALVRTNHLPQAAAALERAVALSPDDVNLRNNHAATLVRMQRHREAREVLDRLIAEHGEQPGFLANLTNALISLGEHVQALATARRLTELHPDLGLSWRCLCNALPYCEGIGGAELLATYRRAAEAIQTTPAAPQAKPRNTPEPDRRLRIGLLSPTLKTHPVGWFTIAGLEALDPAGFDIVCLGRKTPDALQRRFQAIASEWHTLEGPDPAGHMRALDIDILIDLGGYGDQGMMPLCAGRLAPVQMKWVGSQNHSTGLPTWTGSSPTNGKPRPTSPNSIRNGCSPCRTAMSATARPPTRRMSAPCPPCATASPHLAASTIWRRSPPPSSPAGPAYCAAFRMPG